MSNDQVNMPTRRDELVIEPEVLPSLEEAERTSGGGPSGTRGPFGGGGAFPGHGGQGAVKPLGCSVGPGCGCIGLPLALVAGAVVSAFMAVLWLLSLGRVPVSIVQLVQRLRRGRGCG